MVYIFKLYFIILITLLPIVISQDNFKEYQDLDLTFYLGSNLSIIKLKDSGKIDYVGADVLLLPRNDSRLKIEKIELKSSPKAVTSVNHKATFYWDEINTSRLNFGIVSKVNINNNIVKINNKVNFPINSDEYKEYLLPTKFIDINSDIITKSHEIVEGGDDLYFAVFNIAEWVRKNIRYDLNTLTEKVVQKSSWVFQNKEGVCDEMTNLFISMLRSVGIPARFVSGTVYSNVDNNWGNHGWAEVYFPDYGWLPFDVTFGEYGWIDPSHLKLSDTADSGENSVEYNWRSRDVNLEVDSVVLTTNLDNKGRKFEPLFDIKASVLNNDNQFGFGSYVPLEIKVTNLNNYYLSTTIVLTRAPEIIGNNYLDILLKPKESKYFYFIGRLQQDLSKNYEYTGSIEAKESFGSNSFYNIMINDKFESLDLSNVKSTIEKLNLRESKKISSYLDLNCKSDKNNYYSDEDIKIDCKVKNKGNNLLYNVNICFKNKCEIKDLKIGEEINFNFKTQNDKNPIIIAETKDIITKKEINLEIIEIPKIYITGINPYSLDYFELTNLSFSLNSDVKAYNISLKIDDKYYQLKDIEGIKTLVIQNVEGKDLINGLRIDTSYYDKIGNKYEKDFEFSININKIPWYAKIINIFNF